MVWLDKPGFHCRQSPPTLNTGCFLWRWQVSPELPGNVLTNCRHSDGWDEDSSLTFLKILFLWVKWRSFIPRSFMAFWLVLSFENLFLLLPFVGTSATIFRFFSRWGVSGTHINTCMLFVLHAYLIYFSGKFHAYPTRHYKSPRCHSLGYVEGY